MSEKGFAGPEGPQSCPRCASAEFSVLFSASDRLYATTYRQFEVVECRQCSLIRLHPQPDPAELPQFYPKNYWWSTDHSLVGWLEGIYRRVVLSDHVRFVRAGMAEEGTVLDVGCGGGSFLAALARPGLRLVGLDFSLEAAQLAWRSGGVPAVCAALEGTPFAAESFSAITLFHVLEHVPRPAEYLAAVHRLLAPDGKVYIQVPNAACWQFLLLGERWIGIDVPRHLTDFRTADLDWLLGQCGFRVLRRKFFSLRDNPAGLATSLAPRLEPMSRRVRGISESPAVRLLKNMLYLALVVAALPVTALEAAAGAGSTVLVEAVKK